MNEYKYNERFFTAGSKQIIDELIENDTDKRILDLMTQVNREGKQVFSFDQLIQIRNGVDDNFTFEQIKLFTITKDDYPVYNSAQMNCICTCINDGFSLEEISFISQLDEKMKPIYEADYMRVLTEAFRNAFSIEEVSNVARLDENNSPIYDFLQAEQIFYGKIHGLDEDVISFYSALNSSELPIFSSSQMHIIRFAAKQEMSLDHIKIFAKRRDEKPLYNSGHMDVIRVAILKALKVNDVDKIKQLKECTDDFLDFEHLSPFLMTDVPVKNIRVYRSLYKLGLGCKDVRSMIDSNFEYLKIKELKYLLTCAKHLNVNPDIFFASNSYNPKLPECVNLVKGILAAQITGELTKTGDPHQIVQLYNVISRCLDYKVDPEEIKYITNTDDKFTPEDMKEIVIASFNGLKLNEIKKVVNHYKKEPGTTLACALDNAIRLKFNNIENVDIESRYNVSIFKDIDR